MWENPTCLVSVLHHKSSLSLSLCVSSIHSAHRTRQQSLSHHSIYPTSLRSKYCSLRQTKQRSAPVTRNEVSLRGRDYFSILHHSDTRSLPLSISCRRYLTCPRSQATSKTALSRHYPQLFNQPMSGKAHQQRLV